MKNVTLTPTENAQAEAIVLDFYEEGIFGADFTLDDILIMFPTDAEVELDEDESLELFDAFIADGWSCIGPAGTRVEKAIEDYVDRKAEMRAVYETIMREREANAPSIEQMTADVEACKRMYA